MGREASVTHEASSSTDRDDRSVATGVLLVLWTIVLVLSGVGGGYAFIPGDHQDFWAGASFSYSVLIGGPLFLMTWRWLTDTHGFRHLPFVSLALAWVGLFAVMATDALFAVPSVMIAVLLTLWPTVSSAALIWVIARARSRERRQRESLAQAT